ncbi:MAG: TVP38/TMEM64 family protein [Clostridia bacterium]|nr:TVP38/TMEM64 family protein [Clostridia bacterium]
MKKKENSTACYEKRRRLFALLTIVAFLLVLVLLTVFFTKILSPYIHSPETLRSFLEDYGWKGRFILFGLQCLQIVIALIPGEVIELGAGYAYGAVEGALICLASVALSSSLIFLFVKRFGAPLVELFISREKMQEMRFINSETKLKRLVFLVFFIPGTPKDALTYFVGLTNLKLSQFLVLTLFARIPSVVSSTVCGQMLGDRNYLTAVLVFAATAVISLLGYYLYNQLVKKNQNN